MFPRIAFVWRNSKEVKVRDVDCIISFNENIKCKDIPVIYINESFSRSYHNFKRMPKDLWFKLYNEVLHHFNGMCIGWAYFGINYYNKKTEIGWIKIPFKDLIEEVNLNIKLRYSYYSIACAILTALFFTKIGLPEKLVLAPKVITYAKDFLDQFFFIPAFIFTTVEYTNDIILEERMEDEEHIVRAFISFLLWKLGIKTVRESFEFFPIIAEDLIKEVREKWNIS